MAMFSIDTVGTVEFDFTGWGIDEKGVIPEPSRHLMSDVMDEVQDIFKRVRGEDVNPDEFDDVREALDRVGEEYSKGMDIGEMTDALVPPMARLCGNVPIKEKYMEEGEEKERIVSWDESGGKPTHSAINALGFRIFLGFMSYAMEQMTSPEASSGGSPRNSTTTSTNPRTQTRQIRRLTKR